MANGLKIMLDPGHGGRDPGAVYDGVKESTIVERLAPVLAERLAALGHTVYLTREPEMGRKEYVSPGARARMANNAGVDLLFSLHCNAFHSPDPRGIRFYVPKDGADRAEIMRLRLSAALAGAIQTQCGLLVRRIPTGCIFDGSKLTVLRRTNAPAVLLELGFVSNAIDRAALLESELIHRAAIACAVGIDLWAPRALAEKRS